MKHIQAKAWVTTVGSTKVHHSRVDLVSFCYVRPVASIQPKVVPYSCANRMVVGGKHFAFCLLWLSGKSPLNCSNLIFVALLPTSTKIPPHAAVAQTPQYSSNMQDPFCEAMRLSRCVFCFLRRHVFQKRLFEKQSQRHRCATRPSDPARIEPWLGE